MPIHGKSCARGGGGALGVTTGVCEAAVVPYPADGHFLPSTGHVAYPGAGFCHGTGRAHHAVAQGTHPGPCPCVHAYPCCLSQPPCCMDVVSQQRGVGCWLQPQQAAPRLPQPFTTYVVRLYVLQPDAGVGQCSWLCQVRPLGRLGQVPVVSTIWQGPCSLE